MSLHKYTYLIRFLLRQKQKKGAHTYYLWLNIFKLELFIVTLFYIIVLIFRRKSTLTWSFNFYLFWSISFHYIVVSFLHRPLNQNLNVLTRRGGRISSINYYSLLGTLLFNFLPNENKNSGRRNRSRIINYLQRVEIIFKVRKIRGNR